MDAVPLRALIFAYSCEPGRGSEPGAGWGMVASIARIADCVVLVSPEHHAALEMYRSRHPDFSVRFVPVPEGRGHRFAARHRITRFLWYRRWLRRAAATARRLQREECFDVVHHVTFSIYWLSSPAVDLGVPAVWGPVGGAVTTPWRLWSLLGWRGIVTEAVDMLGVRLGAALPGTRRTWERATVRISQNEETRNRLPKALRGSTEVWNHALFVDVPEVSTRTRSDHVLWVSALESRKGPRLAIRALATAAADVRMIMVGSGPERRAVERLASRLGVADRVSFRGRVDREEVGSLMASASAVVFTGLREEGGLALAEAMVIGSPIIVLDNGGAATLARCSADPDRVALIEPGWPSDTATRMGAAMTGFAHGPRVHTGSLLDQEAAHRTLREAYLRARGRQ